MNLSNHSRPRRFSVARHIVVVSVVAIAALVIGTAQAVATNWTGNGAEGGFCNDVTEDASVPAGQQSWLFILTPPVTNGPGTLTATFADSGTVGPVTGVVQGNGSVHFTVVTSAGDQLLSASTTATGNNLVVSHCEVGPTPETTTTTTPGEVTTPTTAKPTPTPAAPAPAAAAAVSAAARFTG
jgi:hypothetical protein